MESARSGKDIASAETPITPAANSTTKPPITGMLIQSDEGEIVPANPAQWLYLETKRDENPVAKSSDSGAATSVCQQSLADSLGGKPRGPGVEQVSHWTSVHDGRHHDDLLAHTRRCQRCGRLSDLTPRILDCRDRSYRLGKCATEATSSRSAALVDRYSSRSLATALSFERAGGVYRLRANTKAKTKSETCEVKVLIGFERDAAGASEAQPARPANVPVLPSEAEVERHELTHLPFRSWCRHCVHAKGKDSPHHELSPGGVSKFATLYVQG